MCLEEASEPKSFWWLACGRCTGEDNIHKYHCLWPCCQAIQKRLEEAFRRNNLEYTGFEDQELETGIKKGIKSKVPEPPLPIFLMKSYALQSYLSTLMR